MMRSSINLGVLIPLDFNEKGIYPSRSLEMTSKELFEKGVYDGV
jgi:hypothetical protein